MMCMLKSVILSFYSLFWMWIVSCKSMYEFPCSWYVCMLITAVTHVHAIYVCGFEFPVITWHWCAWLGLSMNVGLFVCCMSTFHLRLCACYTVSVCLNNCTDHSRLLSFCDYMSVGAYFMYFCCRFIFLLVIWRTAVHICCITSNDMQLYKLYSMQWFNWAGTRRNGIPVLFWKPVWHSWTSLWASGGTQRTKTAHILVQCSARRQSCQSPRASWAVWLKQSNCRWLSCLSCL